MAAEVLGAVEQVAGRDKYEAMVNQLYEKLGEYAGGSSGLAAAGAALLGIGAGPQVFDPNENRAENEARLGYVQLLQQLQEGMRRVRH